MPLTHIRLLVDRFDECFRFYRDVMELERTWGAEGEGYADFRITDEVARALFDRRAMAAGIRVPYSPDATTEDRCALIFGVDDLNATIVHLMAEEVQLIAGPEDHPDWGIRTVHFRDPDGNLIEINSPLPREQWNEELQQEAEKYQ